VEQHLKNLGHNAKDSKTKKEVKAAWIILNCRLAELQKACSDKLRGTLDAGLPREQLAESIANALDDVLKTNEKMFQDLVKKPNKKEEAAIGQEDLRQKKFWGSDPQLLVSKNEALALPRLEADAEAHARFWRSAFRAAAGKQGRKRIAIGPVVNQFVYQDATTLSIPDTSAESQVRLSGDVGDELLDLLKQLTPNHKREHPEIRAALALLAPETEDRIRAILDKSNVAGDDRDFLRSTFKPVVQKIIASTARGSSFQRRVAMTEAYAELEKLINKKTRARKSGACRKKGATL